MRYDLLNYAGHYHGNHQLHTNHALRERENISIPSYSNRNRSDVAQDCDSRRDWLGTRSPALSPGIALSGICLEDDLVKSRDKTEVVVCYRADG